MYTQLMNRHKQEKQSLNRFNQPQSRSPSNSNQKQQNTSKNKIFDESKFDYDEAIYDEKSHSTTNFYSKNYQNKKAAQAKQQMQQSNCYQHLMHKAYNNNQAIKTKESPIKKKTGPLINLAKDSITEAYQMEQKMKIDLGENPFDFGKKQANFPNQCASMRSDEGDASEIKVFPNSTKQKLEKAANYKQPMKNKPTRELEKCLERRLFNDSMTKPPIDYYRASSQYHRQNIDSTVVVDTEKIKQDYLNQSFAAPQQPTKSLSVSSHQKNDVISIKLTRNPDKHFYQFIEEYGMILSCQTPSQTQFSPSTSINILYYKYDLHRGWTNLFEFIT